MRIMHLSSDRPKGKSRGRSVAVDEVKSALQMSGVYGRIYDRERITLPPVTMWLKYKEDQKAKQD